MDLIIFPIHLNSVTTFELKNICSEHQFSTLFRIYFVELNMLGAWVNKPNVTRDYIPGAIKSLKKSFKNENFVFPVRLLFFL